MKRFLLITAILNSIVGILSFMLFVLFGGFDLYLGKGTPIWLSFLPSVFVVASAFNFAAAFMIKKFYGKIISRN